MSLLPRLVVLADVPDTSSSPSSSPVLVVAGVALLVAAAVGAWLLIRGSRRSS